MYYQFTFSNIKKVFTHNIMWIMRSKEEDICDYFI